MLCAVFFSSPSSVVFAQSSTIEANTKQALTIGIFPRRDPAVTMRLFKPLGQYLEQKIGRQVTLETAENFKSFNQRLQDRRYDLVHFNQYHYIKAHEKLNYDVLVQNEEFGEKTIRGAIYVRKDSAIDSLAQLRGQTILFGGGKKAMISYIVPRYLLSQHGLQPGDYQERFASSPPNALLATYLKQVVAGGSGDIAIRLPIVTNKIPVDQLKTLVVSEPLAHLPWAIKREIPDTLKKLILDILLSMSSTEEGRKTLKIARLTGLNPAKNEDYDPQREMIKFLESRQP